MYHSITFGDKNTYDDWKIVPKERPFFAPPSVKTNYVDIPGASSKIDFSEALTGYPLYDNRTGSIEFYILGELEDIERKWYEIYSEITNYVHNRNLRAILEDDPFYFYEGRFSVENYAPGNSASEPRSTITINYDVGPYKWNVERSTDSNWLWDPFSFETGVILSGVFGSIPVTTSYQTINLTHALIGYAPLTPEFIVSTTTNSGMYIKFVNPDLNINMEKRVSDGTTMLYDFVLFGSNSTLSYRTVSGTGTLSVRFREGRL